MVEDNKALVESSAGLTRFDPKARNKLVVRGLVALSGVRDADFYFFKGEQHRMRGELWQALDNYEKALRIQPKHVDSLFFAGYCCLGIARVYDKANDNPQRAKEAFQTLIRMREQGEVLYQYGWAIHHNLGVAQEMLGLYEEALESYEQAVELNPENPLSYHGIGTAQYNLGLYEQALESYEQAVELNPQCATHHHGVGNAQYNLGLYEQALESYEQAVELNPQCATHHHSVGNAQYKLGLYEEAIRSLEHAIELNPQKADPWYTLGLCQHAIGLDHQALESFERSIGLGGETSPQCVEYTKYMVSLLKTRLGYRS